MMQFHALQEELWPWLEHLMPYCESYLLPLPLLGLRRTLLRMCSDPFWRWHEQNEVHPSVVLSCDYKSPICIGVALSLWRPLFRPRQKCCQVHLACLQGSFQDVYI